MKPLRFLDFLPYVRYTRRVSRFKLPQTVGQHILKKRREEGLTQVALGERFGVSGTTVMNWEKGHVKAIPAVRMPAVILFLGYDPDPKASGTQPR